MKIGESEAERVVLLWWIGFSTPAIANRLGVTSRSVQYHLHRAELRGKREPAARRCCSCSRPRHTSAFFRIPGGRRAPWCVQCVDAMEHGRDLSTLEKLRLYLHCENLRAHRNAFEVERVLRAHRREAS